MHDFRDGYEVILLTLNNAKRSLVSSVTKSVTLNRWTNKYYTSNGQKNTQEDKYLVVDKNIGYGTVSVHALFLHSRKGI